MNRHMILTNGRSGSNAVVQLLNRHPHVCNYGEVLGPWTLAGRYARPLFRGPQGAANYLDWLYDSPLAFTSAQVIRAVRRRRGGLEAGYKLRRNIGSLGIKEFAINFRRAGQSQYYVRDPALRLVVLLRGNTLARYLSVKALATTHRVALTAEDQQTSTSGPRFELDVSSLVADLDVIEQENELLRSAARDHRGPTFHLAYEDFFGGSHDEQQQKIADLQGFLGVSPIPLSIEHRRIRTEPLARTISNFDEVCEALDGTSHARWLDA